jgi:transketolase
MALNIRRDIITMNANAKTGHTGGPLSTADYAAALFFHELVYDPKDPHWAERDRFHWSMGHVTPVIYSVMAEAGYWPKADLMKFRQFDGHLQGHPARTDTPGIEVSSGSLGQGLSVCVGMALAARLDRHPRRVYCQMGDGEQQEGQIWEAAMSAGHYQLDNLVGYVDCNRQQIDGAVEDIMGIEPIADKYRSFRWHVIDIDGHNMVAILAAFDEARATKGKPSVILARTRMGEGVSFMVDDYTWHGKPPKMDEAEHALAELGTSYAEWSKRLLDDGPATVPNWVHGVYASEQSAGGM